MRLTQSGSVASLSTAKASRAWFLVIWIGSAALNRSVLSGRGINPDQRQTSLVFSFAVPSGPQLIQRTKRTSASVQATTPPRIKSSTPIKGRVRFISNQTSLLMLALWPWRRHHDPSTTRALGCLTNPCPVLEPTPLPEPINLNQRDCQHERQTNRIAVISVQLRHIPR